MMAKHKKTKSLYALKKIPKEMIKSHFMIDQLALEIKLQSYLNHKNVLGIYGFFDNSTHLFIVLEYMEGGTLYSQLKKNKILTEPKAAEIIKQITYAVEYLHDHDIAHRDIKP
jgi:serine/threonine protein kinase